MNPLVTAFMHNPTGSLTYVVQEPDGPRCAVVDPVLDYDDGLRGRVPRASTP
ncbi:MAG: hypothetical protein ACREYF_07270 [Gammaproteobacteria bacterium]